MKSIHRTQWLAAIAMLAGMVALLWRPIHEESATADEAWILSAGYTYIHGMGFRMHPDEPPLAKMWSALPLLAMDIHMAPTTTGLANGGWGVAWARTWSSRIRPVEELFPAGRDDWYFWPWFEGEKFGQLFVYRDNDGDRLLIAGRLMQVALTVLAGLLIYCWTASLADGGAGLLALAMWCFNPVALAHGHLIQTDTGGTLAILAALWTFSRFLCEPTGTRAAVAGAVLGIALVTKLSSLLLLPTYLVLAGLWWIREPNRRPCLADLLKYLGLLAAAGYGVVLLAYAPYWGAPPALPETRQAALELPAWFQFLRPVLIPADFFKAIALFIGSALGQDHIAYLAGEWSQRGWWYYYLVALALKSPLPWLLLTTGALILLVMRRKATSLAQFVPWIGAFLFLAVTLANRMNIGVRHLLPAYAMLAVAVATQLGTTGRGVRLAAWLLGGWLAVDAVRSHPFYIEYFNEFVGGPKNGHLYLLDSNLDWGQDVKRLRRYVDERHIDHIYLAYFGVEEALVYHRIPYTRIIPEEARRLDQGTLVISAMPLMRPEWAWLREQRRPIDRIGYTLFVYRLGP